METKSGSVSVLQVTCTLISLGAALVTISAPVFSWYIQVDSRFDAIENKLSRYEPTIASIEQLKNKLLIDSLSFEIPCSDREETLRAVEVFFPPERFDYTIQEPIQEESCGAGVIRVTRKPADNQPK